MTELAGVSQGAQSHHFPHRVDLVVSAFERLAEQRIDHYRERAARAARRPRRPGVRALLDLLWDDFSSPVFTVAMKLWIAAAEDEELRERLVPVEKRIYANVSELSAEVAGELGAEPGFDRRLAVAMNTVAGLALVREFDPSAGRARAIPWPITARRSSGCSTPTEPHAKGGPAASFMRWPRRRRSIGDIEPR